MLGKDEALDVGWKYEHSATRARPWVGAYLLTALLAVLPFVPVLLGRSSFVLPVDTTDMIIPLETSVWRAFQQRDFPLWLPDVMGGFSLAAYPQYGLFYPGNWIFWALPYDGATFPVAAYHAKVILHVVIMALGTVFLVRRIGLTRLAAVAASVVLATGPTVLAFVVWGNSQPAFAWWPWALAFCLRQNPVHPWRSVSAAGAFLALTVLASPAQPALQLLAVIALWFVVASVAQTQAAGWSGGRAVAVRGLAVILLGMGVSAVSWVPALVDSRDTVRFLAEDGSVLGSARMSFEAFTSHRFKAANLPGFVDPGASRVSVASNYLGIGVLLLVGIAIATLLRRGRRDPVHLFAALVTTLSALYMFAVLLPHIAYHLPGLSLIREPARYAQVFSLGVALLTAYGVAHLQRRRDDRAPWPVPVAALATLPAGAAAAAVWQGAPVLVATALAVLAVIAGAAAVRSPVVLACGLVAVAAVETLAFPYPSVPVSAFDPSALIRGQAALGDYVPPEDDPFRVMALRSGEQRNGPSYLPNAAALVGAEEIWGYQNPVSAAALRAYNQAYVLPVYLRLLNVRYLLTDEQGLDLAAKLTGDGAVDPLRAPVTTASPDLALTPQQLFAVENPSALGFAWLARDAVVVPPDDVDVHSGPGLDTPPRLSSQRDAVESPTFDPTRQVVLEQAPAPTLGGGPGPIGPSLDTARVTSRGYDRVVLEVDASAPSVLTVSQLFDRGWAAEVDGERVELLRANWMLQGVSVPEGRSTVILTFQPASLRIAGVISALAILGLVAGTAVTSAVRRRKVRLMTGGTGG